ncbi:MAG: hypothetical protein U0174_15860 [Polyangiaceae bacterium]
MTLHVERDRKLVALTTSVASEVTAHLTGAFGNSYFDFNHGPLPWGGRHDRLPLESSVCCIKNQGTYFSRSRRRDRSRTALTQTITHFATVSSDSYRDTKIIKHFEY